MTQIKDNIAAKRYEMDFDGQIVFADYRIIENQIHILHVEAPVALRGSGAAGKFMKEMIEDIKRRGLEAVPVCSYAVSWLSRNK